MGNSNILVGVDEHIITFNKALNAAIKGNGSILAFNGESGMGKSTLLRKFYDICEELQPVQNVLVENQAPVGSVKVGQLQPLLPFSKAIELVIKREETKAEKKFAINAGMTLLASLPFAGDVFYAIKELSRDWRQFKHDKKGEDNEQPVSLSMEFSQTIQQLATKGPLVLLFDDMHWCDAQSVELLGILADSIATSPILIVLTYRNSIIEGKGTPLYAFISHYSSHQDILRVEDLQHLNLLQSREMLFESFPQMPNNNFDRWIYDKTLGVPGVISEYIKYFEKYPDKLRSFNSANAADNEKFLPTSLNAAFSQILDEISEEEKNILAVCSSEGREFSAIIVSGLLNIDILSAIKKFRHLQQKTGIIRSLGAKNKYGIKTTIYEFTQAFYYNYFQNTLEFEEKTALHGSIAAQLKQRYNEADSEAIKAQIAPYLAAHSSESGDSETAQTMMLKAAEGAIEMGSADMASAVLGSLKDLDLLTDNEGGINTTGTLSELKDIMTEIKAEKQANASSGDAITEVTDFSTLRHILVENFNTGNYSYARDKATIFYTEHYADLSSTEKLQFLAMMIRIYTELGEFYEAERQADNAFKLLACVLDPISESFIMNAYALLKYRTGSETEAFDILKEIAQNALSLPIEVKLVTLANIASILNETDPHAALQYYNTVHELSGILQYDSISNEVKP